MVKVKVFDEQKGKSVFVERKLIEENRLYPRISYKGSLLRCFNPPHEDGSNWWAEYSQQ